jgi:hypothetical protein
MEKSRKSTSSITESRMFAIISPVDVSSEGIDRGGAKSDWNCPEKPPVRGDETTRTLTRGIDTRLVLASSWESSSTGFGIVGWQFMIVLLCVRWALFVDTGGIQIVGTNLWEGSGALFSTPSDNFDRSCLVVMCSIYLYY